MIHKLASGLVATLTLGPATESDSVLSGLLPVADRFRLNAAHLSEQSLHSWLKKLTGLYDKTGREIPLVMDLQGAKMRVGKIPPVTQLPDEITLFYGTECDTPGRIPVPHPEFFSEIKKDDRITLNDSRVELQISATYPEHATAKPLRNGPLSGGKGLNRSEHPIAYQRVSEFDSKIIERTLPYRFVQYAFSFVHDGSEALLLRSRTGERRLSAKLERSEALRNIPKISASFDELWLCRGDLGAQAGLREMARLQCEFEKQIPTLQKPAILAGQVLEHLTHFAQPTRSEVVHLYQAEQAGYRGIVLSDETAIGKHPLAVARFLQDWRAG